MRPVFALLCSALMMSGCSDASDLTRDLRASIKDAQTSPPRKASQTSPTAPAKPATGPGAAAKASPASSCPDVNPAAYKALEEPTALPPAKPLLSPNDVKRWIEGAEGQITTLKSHLRETATSLSACHSPKS